MAATVLILIGLWWGYAVAFKVPRFVLPTPPEVFSAFWLLVRDGTLWPHLGHTLGIIIAGLGLGSFAGLALGLLLAKSPPLERLLRPYLLFLQTAPKIALAPLLILWFGLGLASKLVLVVSLVFFPIMAATVLGLRSVPANLRLFCDVLNLSPIQRLFRVELPSATPELLAGFKVAAVQAVIGTILAEWLSGGRGLGYLMVLAGTTYKTPMLFAVVLTTSLLGIAIHQILSGIERRLLAWR